MLSNLINWILAALVPGFWTLGHGKLAEKYRNNGYFLFPKESYISLKSPRYFGFGVRPSGRIVGYSNGGKIIGDQYVIEMETDKNGNYTQWLMIGVTGNPERITETQRHFKWNIEHHFKKIKSPVDAY